MTSQPLSSRKCGPLKGTLKVPGDKSLSHRALIFGALAVGETRIEGLLEGEDVLATAGALRALGAEIERTSDGIWHVWGRGIAGSGWERRTGWRGGCRHGGDLHYSATLARSGPAVRMN